MKPLVNICIPVYHSGPAVPIVLEDLLKTIKAQDYPEDRIRTRISLQHCDEDKFVEIVRLVNAYDCCAIFPKADVKGPALNTNSAMSLAEEGYIKIMNQDDLFDHPAALTDMVAALEASESRWLVSACIHTDSLGVSRYNPHMPHWPGEKHMVEAVNRIGCPSVVMFHSSLDVKFDPHPDVCYPMDCDFYIRMQRLAGLPLIHRRPDIVVRMWDNQLSNQMNIAQEIERGKKYMRAKYGYK